MINHQNQKGQNGKDQNGKDQNQNGQNSNPKIVKNRLPSKPTYCVIPIVSLI